jgi:hypothetical protein
MAYIDQFDDLIRESERGKAVRSTRTIAVFDDGLVVCAVSIHGAGKPATGLWRWRRVTSPADGEGNHVKITAQTLGDRASALALAEIWPKAALIPLDVIGRVVLTRPRQVSRLAIGEETADGSGPAESVFLGDLPENRVRSVLGPLLGDRLTIEIPA